MKSIQEYWDQTLQCMQHELNVSEIKINAFFRSIKPVDVKGDTLILSVDIGFYKETIKKTFDSSLKEALTIVFGKPMNYRIFTEAELETAKFDEIEEKPVKEEVEDMTGNKSYVRENGLKTNYEFDNYIVGSSNNFAYAAAVGVAENPGTEYNPLFLYGGAGLGKTHLMHAIGNYYYREQPEAKILYVSCEAFTNELIKAIQEKKTIEFKEKYRRLDILLIDDVQFLAGKESVQEEFFHTFNDLVNANKQIVICSDRKPNEIATLTDRLVSRMQSGIIADITFPSYETRAAILQKKAEQMGVFIPDDVIALIANSSQSNIREMEGLLKKVEAYSKFTNKEINLELAEEALKDVLESNKPNITVEYIQEIVADYYKTSTSELCSKRRTQPLATYRQLAMYLCRKYLEDSLAVIGGKFGGRDHTTVMHSCDKITAMLESDDKLNQDLFVIDKRIKG